MFYPAPLLFASVLFLVVTLSESFSSPSCRGGCFRFSFGYKTQTTPLRSSASEEGGNKRKFNNEQFLEEASRSGYSKIKSMSIEERTRRVLLAEAAEDRVVVLSDELESLLGDDGLPITKEDREEVTILAKQIKVSREQYKKLVNGEDCETLDVLASKSSIEDDTLDLQ